MKIAEELKMLQKKWKKSKARSIQQPLPDGKYSVRIVDARLEKSKSSDRLQVAQVLQVREGQFKKRMIFRYSGLESINNLEFFKRDIKLLGLKIPKNIMKLEKILDRMIGVDTDITLRTVGEFTNIFFNKRRVDEEVDTETEEDVG